MGYPKKVANSIDQLRFRLSPRQVWPTKS